MSNVLVRWLWRDPDPLWRWASGQMARRWWKRPIVGMGAFGLLFAAGALGWNYYTLAQLLAAFWASAGGPPSFFCVWIFGRSIAALYLALFLLVAVRPFFALEALGGMGVLRELSISALSKEEFARLLYWGTYRRAALPSLLLLYAGELASLIWLWPKVAALFVESGGFGSGAFLAGVLLFWLVVKPPLDHMMNLAISWRYWSSSRSKYWGLAQAGYWIVIRYPALMVILFALLFAALIVPATPSGQRQLPWIVGLFCLCLFVLPLKARFARECYRKFADQLDESIRTKLGENAGHESSMT